MFMYKQPTEKPWFPKPLLRWSAAIWLKHCGIAVWIRPSCVLIGALCRCAPDPRGQSCDVTPGRRSQSVGS